jgi:hypothetical protein
MSFQIDDRRKERRISITFPARLCWLDHSGQEISDETFTFNISDSGVGLTTKLRPSVGKRVKVTLDVGGLLGSSSAEIKWTESRAEGFRIGVSFKG